MRLLLTALVLSLPALAQAQSRPPSFFTVIGAQFDKWDVNHDGVLSKEETDNLVVDPSIKGNAAAALVAVHSLQNSKKLNLPPITRSYLQEQAGINGKTGQPDFQRRYINALNKIQNSTRNVFAGSVNLETMHQGRLGDCYLIAPLGSLVHRNPDLIKKMFAGKTREGYLIRFADGHTVTVPPLTDAEVALTGTTEGNGLWLAVLEKAISLAKKQEVTEIRDKDSVAGAIGQGGSTMRFIPLLTGHQGRSMGFHQKDSPPRASEAVVKVNLVELRQTLTQAMNDKRMVCCSTPQETGVPGLTPRHAYAVLNYDAARDVVYLWNPHGNKFIPKGPAGLTHGYPTTDGKFSMSLVEFVKAFRSMSYEGTAMASYSGGARKR